MKKRKKKIRMYAWYIEALDAHTNNLVSEELPSENFYNGALCADRKSHKLWRCGFDLVYRLQVNKKQCNLKFNIWRRIGGGKIEKHNFLLRKKKKIKTAG